MKKINLTLVVLLSLVAQTVHATVVPLPNVVDPKVSTSEAPKWYLLMSSHMSQQDRQNRFMHWDGSELKTLQCVDGVPEAEISPAYLWRLESANDGNASHVYLVNAYDNKRILVPDQATPFGENTPLQMTDEGSVWDYKLSSVIPDANDCADKQYCFDFIGYSGDEAAFLNAAPKEGNYNVTIYETGVHQASGWFFYETEYVIKTTSMVTIKTPTHGKITVKKEDGSIVCSGDELKQNTLLFVETTPDEGYVLQQLCVNNQSIKDNPQFTLNSDVTITAFFIPENLEIITENPFETMIRLGRMSNTALYTMPKGFPSATFITSAMTTGDAVIYPLGYVRTADPNLHFVIVSKETTLLTSGKDFDLTFTGNSDFSTQNISFYTDWNRDGNYEKDGGTFSINQADKSVTKTFSIPYTAKIGKSRIRVRLESSSPASADSDITGKAYDFVVYVIDRNETNDCQITVSSNNNNLGTAYIETDPNESGRYEIGTEVTIKATTHDGKVKFDGWFIGEKKVSDEPVYTFTVGESMHLTAVFSITTAVTSSENPLASINGRLVNGMVILKDLPENYSVKVISLTGQILAVCSSNTTDLRIKLNYPEQFVMVLIESNQGNKNILKLLNR